MMRKDEPDLSFVLRTKDMELDNSLSYVEHLVKILDLKEKKLRKRLFHWLWCSGVDMEKKNIHESYRLGCVKNDLTLFENVMNHSMYYDFPIYYEW